MLQYLLLLETDREREFFKKIYKQHKDEMYYFAHKILQNQSDAEDIVQDTFLTLIDNIDKIIDSEPHKVRNYIITIVKNKSYNLYKRKKIQIEGEQEEWEQNPVFEKGPDIIVEEAEQQEMIKALLKEMKSPYQEVLTMQYYHELSTDEIAEVLETTADNVRHISMRARRKLLSKIKESGFPDEY